MARCEAEQCPQWTGQGCICEALYFDEPREGTFRCSNCYLSYSGWWCDACGTWPCLPATCGGLAS